jgi:hypothetical protein
MGEAEGYRRPPALTVGFAARLGLREELRQVGVRTVPDCSTGTISTTVVFRFP